MIGLTRMERNGSLLLLASTLLVGLSIVLDGTPSKLINGVAGLAWFVAAGMLLVAALRQNVGMQTIGLVLGLTALVAFVVKPSDIVLASIGFGAVGLVVGAMFPRHGLLLAKLVVGLYLPFHIGTAVLRAIARSLSGSEASLRTDPPPTAAVVPLVMLLAAVVGAEVVRLVRQRGDEDGASESRVAGRP